MLVTGFGTPIVLTWLGYLPFFSTLFRKLKPYLIWPSLIGTYHARPLPFSLGNAPALGQSLYISMFLILNIVLTSVNYQSRQPNAWYSNGWREIMAYVLYRTGALAYMIAPLIWLFAGRNNILLWSTNWSRSTFLLLHRWIARIFTLQVLLHSIIAVILYKAEGTYAQAIKSPYWIWGILATLSCVLLTFGSGRYVRDHAYEFFLLKHVVLSVVLIVGCWYHAFDLYKYLGGYEDWMIAVSVIWIFDRLGRALRIAVVGRRRAKVTALNQDYVRIDIPGIRWGSQPGKHVYVYFPTLHPLKPWENHPFSVLQTATLSKPPHARVDSSDHDNHHQSSTERPSYDQHDVEKTDSVSLPNAKEEVVMRNTRPDDIGLTLYIRKSSGATKNLAAGDNLLTLVEGPYPSSGSTRDILRCDRLVLIGGGVGITGLVPFFTSHRNVKLAWSLKESARCLLEDLHVPLGTVADKDVRIGTRVDVRSILRREVEAGWKRVGVVVCGPGGLCDEVRVAVTAASKVGTVTEFELEVEAYSW